MKQDNNMERLRSMIRVSDVRMWEVAKEAGISVPTLCTWFRTYDANHYQRILNAFMKLERQRGSEN